MMDGGYATIYVTDFGRAVDFYSKTLGLRVDVRAGDHWAELRTEDGFRLGLHPWSEESKTPKPGTHGSISVGFAITKDIDDVVKELTKRGVKFCGPVVDDDPVRLAFFTDPDGNALYLSQMNPQYA